MAVMVAASSRSSGGPVPGSSPVRRSPSANRVAAALSRRSGEVTERAITQPTRATTARTTTAMPASASHRRWMRSFTSATSSVSRTLPCTWPPDATGSATYCRSVPRVSDRRVPVARPPLSARMISGLVEKSRGTAPPVSTRDTPAASVTTTRAPVRRSYSSAGVGSSSEPASRASS